MQFFKMIFENKRRKKRNEEQERTTFIQLNGIESNRIAANGGAHNVNYCEIKLANREKEKKELQFCLN